VTAGTSRETTKILGDFAGLGLIKLGRGGGAYRIPQRTLVRLQVDVTTVIQVARGRERDEGG
jgi:hypothetical protein